LLLRGLGQGPRGDLLGQDILGAAGLEAQLAFQLGQLLDGQAGQLAGQRFEVSRFKAGLAAQALDVGLQLLDAGPSGHGVRREFGARRLPRGNLAAAAARLWRLVLVDDATANRVLPAALALLRPARADVGLPGRDSLG